MGQLIEVSGALVEFPAVPSHEPVPQDRPDEQVEGGPGAVPADWVTFDDPFPATFDFDAEEEQEIEEALTAVQLAEQRQAEVARLREEKARELAALRDQREAAARDARRQVYDQHRQKINEWQRDLEAKEQIALRLLGEDFQWMDPSTMTNPFLKGPLEDWRAAAQNMQKVDDYLERKGQEAAAAFDDRVDALSTEVDQLAEESIEAVAAAQRAVAEEERRVEEARKQAAALQVAQSFEQDQALLAAAFDISVGDLELISPTGDWRDAFETTRDASQFRPGDEGAEHSAKSEQLLALEQAMEKILAYERTLRESGMSQDEIRDTLLLMSDQREGGVIPVNFLPYYCCKEAVEYAEIVESFEQERTAERQRVEDSLKSELGEDLASAREDITAVKDILIGPLKLVNEDVAAAVDLLVLGGTVALRHLESQETREGRDRDQLYADNFQGVSAAVLGAIDADVGKAFDATVTLGRAIEATDHEIEDGAVRGAANSIVRMTEQIKRDRAILQAADKLFDAIAGTGALVVPALSTATAGKQLLLAAAEAVKRAQQYNQMIDLMIVAEARGSAIAAAALQNRADVQKIEIKKQTVKGIAAGIEFAGGVADLAGPAAPTGTVLKAIGKATSFAADKAFARYGEARLRKAWAQYRKVASLGHNDRHGMLEVLEKHDTLAKYALAYMALRGGDSTARSVFLQMGLTEENFEAADASVRTLVDYMTVKGEDEPDSFDEPTDRAGLTARLATRLKDKITEDATEYNPRWTPAGSEVSGRQFLANCGRAATQAGYHRSKKESAIAKALARVDAAQRQLNAVRQGAPASLLPATQVTELQVALREAYAFLRGFKPKQSARGEDGKHLKHEPMTAYVLELMKRVQESEAEIQDLLRTVGQVRFSASVETLDANINSTRLNASLNVGAWQLGINEVNRVCKSSSRKEVTVGKKVLKALRKLLVHEAALDAAKGRRESLLDGSLEDSVQSVAKARKKLKQELVAYRDKHSEVSQKLYQFVTEFLIELDRLERPEHHATVTPEEEAELEAQLESGNFDTAEDLSIDAELEAELEALAAEGGDEGNGGSALMARALSQEMIEARATLAQAKQDLRRAADSFASLQDELARVKAQGVSTDATRQRVRALSRQLKDAGKLMRTRNKAHERAVAACERAAQQRREDLARAELLAPHIAEHVERHAAENLRIARELEADAARQLAELDARMTELAEGLEETFSPLWERGAAMSGVTDADVEEEFARLLSEGN